MYSHYLDTFICVADCGSFAKAGESLFISATAVMKQINHMESALGFPLFERTPRGLSLTPAGKSYYQDARYMIQYAQESRERAQQAMLHTQYTIRVGVSALAPASLLMELWPRILKLNPYLKLKVVHFENSEKQASTLHKAFGIEHDVIVTMHDEGTNRTRGISSTVFCFIPLCIAVPLDHPLSARDWLTMEYLYGETLMLIRKGWGNEMDRLRRDILLNHAQICIHDFQTYSIDVFNECVNQGRLLVAVEDWKNVHPLLRVIPVHWPYQMSLGLIHARSPEPHVQAFLHAAKQAYLDSRQEEHKPTG